MRKVIDLTGPLFNGMWSYNSLPRLGVRLPHFESHLVATRQGNGFEALAYQMSSLSGCYLETGAHLLDRAPLLSDLPIEEFIRPAVICHLPRKSARQLITRRELEAACPPTRLGDALLIECGWGSQWRSPTFVTDGPSFHCDCLPWLLDQPFSLLGVDVPCMQSPWAEPGSPESGAGMLTALFARGILLLAPLVNLDQVGVERGELIALPLNIEGASGAPCRAVLCVDA